MGGAWLTVTDLLIDWLLWTVVTICSFFRMDVHCLLFDCKVGKVGGACLFISQAISHNALSVYLYHLFPDCRFAMQCGLLWGSSVDGVYFKVCALLAFLSSFGSLAEWCVWSKNRVNGTVIAMCSFFGTDVHCLISDCDFSRGLEVQTLRYEEIKFDVCQEPW